MANVNLPSPPVLKTTIIHLNKELEADDNNYEILTNDYSNTSSSQSFQTSNSGVNAASKKKRRRSSANVDSEELAKRKHETKQLHSIIEKRRRIKINREFEALKYLIPACRNSAEGQSTPGKKASTNNSNKIDGMYKLTILKSSVEYILYLHHIIQQQHKLLNSHDNYNYDINFTQIPLDVNQYRNIDKEYSFKDLMDDLKDEEEDSDTKKNFNGIASIEEDREAEEDDGQSYSESLRPVKQPRSASLNPLPSPEITPDMAPVLSMLNRCSEKVSPQGTSMYNTFSFSSTGKKSNLLSGVSPFTKPLLSTISSLSSNSVFLLPDPAIDDGNTKSTVTRASSDSLVYPQRKFFKSKTPNNVIISSRKSEDNDELADQDASKALLLMRKSSIDSLLN